MPTVQKIIDRILSDAGLEPFEETVDTIKEGDPEADVRGVATTFLATHDVLRRAIDADANFVITHEPIYYNHTDDPQEFEGDPVFETKRALIRDNGLTVWRWHDYAHAMRPDAIMFGMARQLDAEGYQDREDPTLFRVPPTTVAGVVAELRERTGARAMRVVGDPQMPCSVVRFSVGAAEAKWQIRMARDERVEVLIVGETHEWETVEYVRDAAAQGRRIALVLLGHRNSEEGGMIHLAERVRQLYPALPVTFIAAGDPCVNA